MKPNRAISDYWQANYLNGDLCGLCGNRGKIDTTGRAITPKGEDVGGVHYCLCPNGQTLRQAEKDRAALMARWRSGNPH